LIRLLDYLDGENLLNRSVIVLTSDHGEEFWEHGQFEHGHALRPEVVRIPLLIVRPGGPGGVVRTDPASLVDVMPTLLGAAGLDVPRGLNRALFCRDAGFAHIGRYVTGLILSPNKTLQGIYALQVWEDNTHSSRRAMHEAIFEAG
jgi:membrane-anchored protein YejM (alkaline phosphatase superfamily)